MPHAEQNTEEIVSALVARNEYWIVVIPRFFFFLL